MVSAEQKDPGQDLSDDELRDMEKHGITRSKVSYFHCGAYRYTNLKDAIAEAKRQKSLAAD